ncbi:MAG: acyltransferase family protein [Candidatus Gastranaerophilales bacterium]|nr:acyltransferase family protein [Candidatus Gastranaerophilales bacterium]
MFDNKVNVLKALAIMTIVSGHLEFSLIPMFPPYSYNIALFFFISGYLFKEKYLDNILEFLSKKVKTLLIPYYSYIAFYLVVTIAIDKITGHFWGMSITLKNYLLTPFINGHQLDFACPLWFVTQLFITFIFFLFIYRKLKELKDNKWFHLTVFFILALISMPLSEFRNDDLILVIIRTLFSMFFVYLGLFYKNNIEGKFNIFSTKILFYVIALQSLLWLTNKDYKPEDGVGLSYVLVWGEFDSFLIPILTSITGIWALLFIVEILYPYLKDNKFIYQMGQNTYHIMANHVFIMYLITVILMAIKGIPIEVKNSHDIYWFLSPLKTTYFYFIVTMIVSTYIGVGLKAIRKRFEG